MLHARCSLGDRVEVTDASVGAVTRFGGMDSPNGSGSARGRTVLSALQHLTPRVLIGCEN